MGNKKAIIGLVLVLLAAAGSYWAYNTYYTQEETDIIATGTIEATLVELNTKVAGSIKTMSMETGETVKKGQLVAEISRNDLVAQYERDALGVLKAEAMLADLESGARSQELDEASLGVEVAQVNYDQAAQDLNRAQTLFEEGVIPEAELEKLSTKEKLTQKQLTTAQTRLSLLQSGSRTGQIKAAQAEVDRNKAVLKASQSMLQDLKVYSPLDGQVLTKNQQAGEFVPMGSSLYTVADLNNLWIKVYLPTDDLPWVKIGQQVQFTVSGVSAAFNGVVEEIASKGEFTPKTIQTQKERANVVFGVKIAIDNQHGALKPGMPADVNFGSGAAHD